MKIKSSISRKIFNVFNILIVSIFAFLCMYPFYYIIIYSLSTPELAIRGVYFWPRGFTFVNYIRIFADNALFYAFLMSILRTVLGTVVTLIFCTMFAYGISKPFLPFRRIMYRGLVVTMYISVGIIPWFVTMRNYGLQNNFLLYILPSAMGAFFVVLLKTFFEQLPSSMEEAAKLDGAGYFRIFISVILPLSTPILATIALFSGVGQWNSWFDNFMLNRDPRLQTLPFVLFVYLNSQSINLDITNVTAEHIAQIRLTPQSIRAAVTAIVAIPIFLLYPFVQRYFVKGLLIGAVKG